ncbi:MAG: 8-amino-7-oxononanoate synthase [Gammaproteobacteria bacterium]|nr:8-amino-7-oxononanoate synthase [Gammaproteobacteria bacterium]
MSNSTNSLLAGSVKKHLREVQNKGLFRKAEELQSRDQNTVIIDGRQLLNFSSNDYLGLSVHPQLIETINNCARAFGYGSTASPLVCGKTSVHTNLEKILAERTGRDRALLFASGYQANLGLISALSKLPDMAFFIDRLCHASIIDGVLLSRAKFKRFNHADVADMDRLLRESQDKVKLVLTEAVFSMDGDISPLPQLVSVASDHAAKLVVDDAHGFGIMGNKGAGTLSHFHLGQDSAPLMVGTFGKALGLQGAFVAGEDELIELLVQCARPYIYSTAMSIPLAAGVIESLKIIEDEPERIQRLFERINYFQQLCTDKGIQSMNTNTPIQPIILGDSGAVMRSCEQLKDKGIFVVGIRPPTVPEGTARIRISINSNHQPGELDLLVDALADVLKDKNNV